MPMGATVHNFFECVFRVLVDVLWTMLAKDLLVAVVIFYTRLNSLQTLAKL